MRKKLLTAVATLIVFVAVSAPRAQAQTGWLAGWNYRNPVTVSNSTGSTLSNFQVHMTLSSSFDFTKPKSGGSDIRFTASDGTTLIPFYIESWNSGSTSASLWVNVPSIPTAGTTVYLYYGNAAASSASSGDATFNFFDDFSYGTAVSSATINTAIGKAITWIEHGQDAITGGGVSYYYDTSGPGWYPQGYPEVSGYILPTLYDTAAANNISNPTYAAQLRARAKQIADWELTVQSANGSWIYVFDTGQIVEGLARAYQETGTSSYLTAAEKAATWLVSVQAADGSWSDFGFPHAYDARVSRNLLKLWQVDGNNTYMTAATKNLNWVLTQQQANGWFNNNGISNTGENSAPLTHTIAYTMEGLFDSGVILSNSTYITAAKKTADALLAVQQAGGMLTGGNYDSNWSPTNVDQVLTGDAQTAMMWLRLYNYSVSQGSPNSAYLNAAVRMNQYLMTVQGNSVNTGIDGGLAGSDPINGPYEPNFILPWATKFFVDDLNLEAQIMASATVTVPALDPSKWSFPAGQAGFSNTCGALRYTGPTAGFGPRAVAMKNSASVPFSDGVVEYNFQGSGGNNEFALMYRGQIPETSNSYVFYPTTFNSQNAWQNYKLQSGAAANLGTGGVFAQGTTYSIKAAIGGTSHTFSVNGTPIITSTDATFSSGDFGLMAWGNAITSITNFRLRQYASADPTTTVGSTSAASGYWIVSVSLNPTGVTGGTSTTGTVTIYNPTASSQTVTLSSSNAAALVPASVTVAAGLTTATFTVTTIPVAAPIPVTISGTLNLTATTILTVNPPAVSGVSLSPSNVTGGLSSTGTVILNGQAPAGGAIILLSSNSAAATVPPSVTVPQGAIGATFAITTSAVTTVTTPTITANYSGTQSGILLTVNPPVLALVTLSPPSVVGGISSTGTVTLTGPAPTGGISVALSSDNPGVATVPASINVVAGQTTSAQFTIATSVVSLPASANIIGNHGGSQSANLGVYPVFGLSAVSISPAVVTGGTWLTGTVTLGNPAPAGGAVVTLSGNNNIAAIVSPSVTVPPGSSTAPFDVITNSVSAATVVTVTGSYNGIQSTTLIINPIGVSPTTVWPDSAVPNVVDGLQTTPGEYGVRFFSDADGYVLGVRFYKGTQNTGTHVGNLWSTSGQLLATAMFTGETASGWQQVIFSNPVHITANTNYVASYYTPTGDFSYNSSYFSLSQVDAAPLHMPADTPSTPNGVFASGFSSSFPNSTSNSTNYWVDVLFDPTPTSLTVATTSLPDGFQGGFYTTSLEANGGTAPYTWSVVSGSLPTGLTMSPSGLISGATTQAGYFNFTVQVTDNGALPQSVTQPLATYIEPSDICPCTIWPDYKAPHILDSLQTTPGEFGTRFHSDTDGNIAGVRFYKGPSNTGTHVGNLWSASGQLLATVTFTGESASGWQEADFSNPVHITANTDYIVSYYSPTGDFSYNSLYFALGIAVGNAPLHMPADSPSTPNGVFAYGPTSSFPNNTFESTNYWVDVVFNPVTGPIPVSLSINPTSAVGGGTTTGTVTLSAAAPQGGETIGLSSNASQIASVPSTVTVPQGATSANFTVTAFPANIPLVAIITATGNGMQSGTVTVNPPSAASVSVNPSTVNSGYSSTGTVTLNGPAPIGDWMVTLSSDNPAVTVPFTVTVPRGSTSATFMVNTTTVGTVTPVTISAPGNVTTTLTLEPFALAVASVSLNPSSLLGSSSSVGTVTLNGPAPAGGAVLTLSSNNPAATVPGSVTVLAGRSTATFTVNTTAVASATMPIITATLKGLATAQLTVNPPAVSSVSLTPTSVTGGSINSTGTVTLNGPAPTGGIAVALSSGNTAAATVTTPVTVAGGATTATFTVTSLAVASQATAVITATLNGSANTTLTVTPAATLVSSVSLNPTSIVGGVSGQTSTGTVTLNGTAPSGGTVVTLTSGTPAAATVPGTVTVPANTSSTTFTVTPIAVLTSTSVSISAKVAATAAQSATLNVVPPSVISVTMNPKSVEGGVTGSNSTGTVTLNGPVAAGALSSQQTVNLSNSSSAVTIPTSILVPIGATTQTFTATTSKVVVVTIDTITAAGSGTAGNSINGSANTTLTVTPPVITSVTLNPTSVTGGSVNSTGTVTLDTTAPASGITVTLASDNTAAATVLASVTVASGSSTATFTATSKTVASTSTANISATFNGGTKSAALTVTPAATGVASLTLNPTSVTGGAGNSTATITLNGTAPSGGASVTVSSSITAAATVSSPVTVPANTNTMTFIVTSHAVAALASPVITATYLGVPQTATLAVNPPAVSSVVLNPTSVTGGLNNSTGTVTLNGPAPTGGIVVALASDNTAAASVPAGGSVTVAVGNTTATFTITSHAVATTSTANISGTLNGTQSAPLMVIPPAITSVTLSPTSVIGGVSSTGTVHMNTAAPTGGLTITLASTNTAVATVPASVSVAGGATTATFTVTSIPVSAQATPSISATFNGGTQSATLTVNPPTLSNLTLSPTTVTHPAPSTGTVTISGAAPAGGFVVNLSSSNITVGTVPATMTVAAGATSGTFTVTTLAAAPGSGKIRISASKTGSTTQTAQLTVN